MMDAEATSEPERRAPPAFWALLVLVILTCFDGLRSPADLFLLPTIGAALGGFTARRSPALGGAALGLGVVALILLLAGAASSDELSAAWPVAVYELIVGAVFAGIGWNAARPGRSPGELFGLAVAGVVCAVLAGLIGFVGLFALACSGGC